MTRPSRRALNWRSIRTTPGVVYTFTLYNWSFTRKILNLTYTRKTRTRCRGKIPVKWVSRYILHLMCVQRILLETVEKSFVWSCRWNEMSRDGRVETSHLRKRCQRSRSRVSTLSPPHEAYLVEREVKRSKWAKRNIANVRIFRYFTRTGEFSGDFSDRRFEQYTCTQRTH